MPLYDIECANCGKQETAARMSEAASFMPCPICGGLRPQIIGVPQFTEDRVRFFRGANGDGYSFALGQKMPDSRSERDRIAKEKGVEFISRAEHLAENKEAAQAVAYKTHVEAGGDRALDKPPVDTSKAFVPKPDWAKALGV